MAMINMMAVLSSLSQVVSGGLCKKCHVYNVHHSAKELDMCLQKEIYVTPSFHST